jgi:hypothetical protein
MGYYMSRWKASAIHLAISLSVLLSLGLLLSVTWYPPDYVAAVGGLGLIAILGAVDATLGPLLTLVVFDAKKPGIKFDLTVIALLQVLAMAYGLHTIFLARPVYTIFGKDRFDLVSAADLPPERLAEARREEFKSLPLTGPRIIGVKMPDDPKEREQVIFAAAAGLDLPYMPRYYLPYRSVAAEVLAGAKPLDALQAKGEDAQRVLAKFLESAGMEPQDVKFLPLRSRHKDQTVLVDGESAKVLGIVDLNPW